MSFKYSQKSLERLGQCHPDLQRLFHEVIKYADCTILCGHRNQADQEQAFKEGKSKLKWPLSKHNQSPSMAVDVAPAPVDWEDLRRFYMFAGIVMACAGMLEIKVRCGADWDGDFQIKDQNFHDIVHFELVT